MKEGFLGKLNKILKPKAHLTQEELAFMAFSNKELLIECLPELSPATLEVFSSLNYKAQQEIVDNVKKQTDANINHVEVLNYTLNFIKANRDLELAIMSGISDKNYQPPVAPKDKDAEEYAVSSAANFIEQATKRKQ
jgi:hypothetical protein